MRDDCIYACRSKPTHVGEARYTHLELFIIKPVEEKIKGVTGLEKVRSTGAYGSASFSIEFSPTDNLSEKWDGTYKGTKVPAGGYMYEIVARSHEDESVQKSGKVLVII